MQANRCPQCDSEETARLHTIHEHGTSQTQGTAFGVDAHGGLEVADFGATTQTNAAIRAAPPAKKDLGWPIVTMLACGVAIIWAACALLPTPEIHHRNDLSAAQRLFSLAIIVVPLAALFWLGAHLFRRYDRYNSGEWRKHHAAWLARWMCRRCGNVFVPSKNVEPSVPIRLSNGGPRRYRVEGVDRETKMDTLWHCSASSEANARAKAELEGILVTDVQAE